MPVLADERSIDPKARAFAQSVSDKISSALGRYVSEMAEAGVTLDHILAKLRRAIDEAGRQ